MQAISEPVLIPPGAATPALSLSVVCVDQTRLGEHIDALSGMGLSRLHIDITEPAFGGALGLPLETLGDLRRTTRLPIDVHVMLTDPDPLLPEIADRGADAICVHQRTMTGAVIRALRAVARRGVRVGLALDPGQHVDDETVVALEPDYLTVMSVVPGGAGRPFRRDALGTLRQAARLRAAGAVDRVEADGAVGPVTAPELVRAGADQLVLGSTVFPDRVPNRARLAELRQALTNASHHPTRQGASS
ncbi:ribulose-phosphate 3-epimerase [Micromonospora sp. WMMD1274]|uniref:ribulose-phosphate 3-epimerase n=1 Tax=Micromonospora sp. WMMD1274 TaxID=3404116 RepID=UPI003B937467